MPSPTRPGLCHSTARWHHWCTELGLVSYPTHVRPSAVGRKAMHVSLVQWRAGAGMACQLPMSHTSVHAHARRRRILQVYIYRMDPAGYPAESARSCTHAAPSVPTSRRLIIRIKKLYNQSGVHKTWLAVHRPTDMLHLHTCVS